MNILKCPECGAVLKQAIGFTGCDWDSKAGEGSGYDWEISLNCTNDSCARIYTIGFVKNDYDFVEPIEKRKCTL